MRRVIWAFAALTCSKTRFRSARTKYEYVLRINDGVLLDLFQNVHCFPVCGFLLFCLQIAIEPIALFHRMCDYRYLTDEVEDTYADQTRLQLGAASE